MVVHYYHELECHAESLDCHLSVLAFGGFAVLCG